MFVLPRLFGFGLGYSTIVLNFLWHWLVVFVVLVNVMIPRLPVTSFLKYTLEVLAFKCVKGLAPSYLCYRFKTRACVHDRNNPSA